MTACGLYATFSLNVLLAPIVHAGRLEGVKL
jgi:hypothetical protein